MAKSAMDISKKIYEKQKPSLCSVAVTGGTGFIGKRLVIKLLEEGYSVRVLTRDADNKSELPNEVDRFKGDLSDPECPLDRFLDGVEVLYHCAGELRRTSQMQNTHVGGTERLANAASNRVKHWVQLSSVGVYGKLRDGEIDENSPTKPVGIYEKTKLESDNIVLKKSFEGHFTLSILRPANVYGIGMPGQSLEKLVNAIRKGFFFFIGPPGATVNFVHVDDVVEALLLCGKMQNASNGIFNLSDSRTIEDFVEIISTEYDKKPTKIRLSESFIRVISIFSRWFPVFSLTPEIIDTMVSKVIYSNARLVNELGYSQKRTLENGLHEYITSKNRDIYQFGMLDNGVEKKGAYDADQLNILNNQVVFAPKTLWVLFFCFTVFASIVFQEFLLPFIPSLHAGQGLLTKDPLAHHNLAIALMERIQNAGWSEWTLWQQGMSSGLNSSLLAALYVIFGPDPSLLIPVHAALHATSGLLLFLIGRLLWRGSTGAYGGLLASFLFILFPSSINWYAQPLKDGYIIAGTLLVLFCWLKLIINGVSWKNLSSFVLGNLVGFALIVSVKPYALHMIMIIMPIAYCIGILSRGLQLKNNKKLFWGSISVLLMLCVIFHFGDLSNLIQQREIAYSETVKDNKTQYFKNWHWRSSRWVPVFLDRYASSMSTIRIGLTSSPEAYNAYSTIDRDVMPSNFYEMVAYLPRALQIALWAPFPNTWFVDFSVTHVIGWLETIVWYLLMPGILLTFHYKKSPGIILSLVFSLGFLAGYGYVTANIGTLHRIRYPYLFVLILIGLLGWVNFYKNYRLKKIKRFNIENPSLSPKLKFFSSSGAQGNQIDITRTYILNTGVLVSFLTIISYLLLFSRDMIMAKRFGLGSELDGFYLAFVMPMFIVNIVSIPFGAMIVPIYQEIRIRSSFKAAQEFITNSSSIVSGLLFVVSLSLLLIGTWMLRIVGWGFDTEQLAHSQNILPFAILLLFLSGFVVIGNSVLNAHHYFILPILAQMIVPVIAIISLQFFGNVWGISSVVIGMCFGQVLNLFVVLKFLNKEQISICPRYNDIKISGFDGAPLFIALAIAALFMNGTTIIDNALASTLGIGSVSAYSLGSKIVLFITGTIGASIVTVLLPHFSSFFASNQARKGQEELRFYLFLGTIISIPLGLGLFFYAENLIRSVFVGGQLGAQSSHLVASVTSFGVIQLPFFTSYTLMIKFINASQKNTVIVIVSFLGLLLNVALDILFIKYLGVSGLALATSISMFVMSLFLMLSLNHKREMKIIDISQLLLLWLLYLSAIICIQYQSRVGVMICSLSIFLLSYLSLRYNNAIPPEYRSR